MSFNLFSPLRTATLTYCEHLYRYQKRYLFWHYIWLWVTAIAIVLAKNAWAAKEPVMFNNFIVSNGAITVFAHGDYVEPYTAIKALLITHRLGGNIQAPAAALAHWLLPYQQANGPFPRICRSGSSDWLACGPADADDSLAVFWCLMVNEILAHDRTLDASCTKSLEQLATLWNPELNTFQAVFGQPNAYFADNVEIIDALSRLRANPITSERYAASLRKLPSRSLMLAALSHNYGFYPDIVMEPQRASIPATPHGFYPYGVAPAYTWIYDISSGSIAIRNWTIWKHRYGKTWLDGKSDHFPWGLVAWAAYKLGDIKTAQNWLQRSAQWRQQGRWNVLEEGVRLGLENALNTKHPHP